jgi:hypothetical protein
MKDIRNKARRTQSIGRCLKIGHKKIVFLALSTVCNSLLNAYLRVQTGWSKKPAGME